MGAIASTDVTVTLAPQDRDMLGFAHKISFPVIAFGDASKTYPANGVPMPAIGAFGMNKVVKRMRIDGINGYKAVYDADHNTIRLFASGASGSFTFDPLANHTHDIRVIGGVTADEDLGILSSGPTLGKLAASNRVLAGADQATKGGVVPASAGTPVATGTLTNGPLGEVATGAVCPTLTLYAEVVGN